MKRKLNFVFLALMSVFMAHAGGAFNWSNTGKDLLMEYFTNVKSTPNDLTAADPSQFDNPDGWVLKDVFAGDHCVYIKPGGSITLPLIKELTGNAQFWIEAGYWETDEEGFPCYHMSIENGELLTSEFDKSSMFYSPSSCMFGVSSETRLTLHADGPLQIKEIKIRYPNIELPESDCVQYDPAPGDFTGPIDLIITPTNSSVGGYESLGDDGSHNFAVYTLDGTTPDRTSPRVTGPIHIDKTTTVQVGTVFGCGALILDSPKKYDFKIASAPETPEETYEISVTAPGQLQAEIKKLDADVIDGLVVKGKINGEDLAYLNSGTGRMGSLAYLNLSDVTFEYDGTEYAQITFAPEGGMGTTTVCHYIFSEENWNDFRNVSPSLNQDTRYRNDLSAAFYRHPTLKHVVLPSMLTDVGEYAFSKCDKLEAVTTEGIILNVNSEAFSSSRAFYYFDLSSLERIDALAFVGTGIKGAVDLSNAKVIGDWAFTGAKINSITFGERPYIGDGAFSGNQISMLNLPAPPDSIPTRAFSCETLKTVTIGEGLKYIGDAAFGPAVEELNLPNSVEEMGKDVIPTRILAKIEAEDGIKYIGKVAYSRDSDQTSYTIKEGTISLSPELFYFSNIESITLPSSLKIIGTQAFYGAKLKKTPDMQGVVRIGDQAFMYNTNMAKAVLPENLELIGSQVFEGNSALWSLEFNCIDIKDDDSYGITLGNVNLEEIKIGPKVRRIPRGLFYRNSMITEVELPSSVEILDYEAFYECSNLKSVRSDGQIKSIGEYAFRGCSALEEVPMFDVDSIPDYSFNGLKNLKNIKLSNKTKKIGIGAFEGCENLNSINLSDNITKIGGVAFYGCKNLSDFHWPLALEEIGNSAFAECESLEVVSLPEGVKNVEYGIFSGCKSIKNLYIPSTINTYEKGAFTLGNDNMGATVTCMLAEPPAISYWNSNNRVALAKVPAASLEAYKAHPDWAFLGDNIIPVEGISAPAKTTVTAFSDNINEDTDLSDTVIGDVYVTLGKEDSYDAVDGSIVLGSTIENQYAEILGGLVPGESDLANRFNGLVVKVGEGEGSVKIDCQTVGSNLLTVKMGAAKPQTFTKSEKGTVDVPYNVATPTYIYVYGTLPENSANGMPAMKHVSRATEEGYIRVYSMTISPNNAPLETEVENVTLSKTELNLTEGETATLTASVMPEDADDKTVTWTSSDESVATVSSEGVVTAVKAGTATITAASANGKTASCTVTVKPAVILAESLTISPESWSGEEGGSFTITATVSPEDTTDKSLTWESSDETVATVDAEGNVTVLKEGSCEITVSTNDGSGLTAKCLVSGLAGIDLIFADPDATVDVYNMQGILLKHRCSREDLKLLQPAIYILRHINGKSTIFVNTNK